MNNIKLLPPPKGKAIVREPLRISDIQKDIYFEREIKAHMASNYVKELENKIKYLENKIEDLEIELKYRPGGKGAKEAQKHFEELIEKI